MKLAINSSQTSGAATDTSGMMAGAVGSEFNWRDETQLINNIIENISNSLRRMFIERYNFLLVDASRNEFARVSLNATSEYYTEMVHNFFYLIFQQLDDPRRRFRYLTSIAPGIPEEALSEIFEENSQFVYARLKSAVNSLSLELNSSPPFISSFGTEDDSRWSDKSKGIRLAASINPSVSDQNAVKIGDLLAQAKEVVGSINDGRHSAAVPGETLAQTLDEAGQSMIYRVVWRDSLIAFGCSLSFWALIVGTACVTTHSWLWPLAIILGLALLPVAVLGGVKSEHE